MESHVARDITLRSPLQAQASEGSSSRVSEPGADGLVATPKPVGTASQTATLRHEVALNAVGEGIFALDRRGHFTFVSPAAARFLGFAQGDLIGRHCSLICVDDRDDGPLPRKGEPVPASWYQGEPLHATDTFRRHDGTAFEVEYVATPTGRAEEPSELVVVFGDVTAHRHAQAKLERLGMAIAQSTEVVIITDADGTIIYANPAFAAVTGYSCEEALGATPGMLKSGHHDRSFYEDMWRTIRGGETWSGRIVNRRKDGRLYTEEATISPVRNHRGEIVNYVAVKRDVTNEIAMARQLLQSQKMQAIGQLASGVAHDMNNILATIMVTATLVEAALSEEHDSRADLQVIFNACRRGRDVVGNLLGFSGKGALVKGPIDLNRIARDTSTLLERSLLRRIELLTELTPDLPAVDGDASQITQAVMNICINAADAIEGRGTIVIRTSITSAVRSSGTMRPTTGRCVVLQVQDSGQGMTEAELARAFEPFFTTKAPEKGTGLGLSMVYGTMNSHGGQVTIDSKLGKGTTVTLVFPALEGVAASSVPPPSSPRPTPVPRGGVLLVDDETELLKVLAKTLRVHGYEVWEANSGVAAVRQYREHLSEIDVVVVDMIMPDMDGSEVIAQLQSLCPDVTVMATSGFADSDSEERARAVGATKFIAKPFELNMLVDELEALRAGG